MSYCNVGIIYVKIVLFFTPRTAFKQLHVQIFSQKSFSFTFSLTHAHLDLSLKRKFKRTISLLKKIQHLDSSKSRSQSFWELRSDKSSISPRT